MSQGIVEPKLEYYFLVLKPLIYLKKTNIDICSWAVLVGRQAFKKVSKASKGQLK